MTKSSTSRADRSGRSGGIKPLNAPRVVYVRTDSAGNPIAVRVPPAVTSPRGRRSALSLAPGGHASLVAAAIYPPSGPLPKEGGGT